MKLFTALSFALFATTNVLGDASDKKCDSIKVRKEWRALSRSERKAWVDAVNCLNKVPSPGKLELEVNTASYDDITFQIAPINKSATYYDDLVYAHMNLNPLIHWTGRFLPWHRVYLHEWTNILRTECGYEGVAPYWAWENDYDNFEESDIWDTDPESGLGGFSDDADDDYTIHTGALDITLTYPVPHKLRRHFIPYPYNGTNIEAVTTFAPDKIEKLLSSPTGNFTAFQGNMEQLRGMHSSIHVMLGGDMGTICPKGSLGTYACPVDLTATFSANDPIFHLHHGNIDRLWWLWQEKSEKNKAAFFGGSVQNRSSLDTYPNGQAPWLDRSYRLPTSGLWDTYTIEETLDTRTWPWCYVYE